MSIPTRFIDKDEFEELVAVEEGNTIPIYKLAALNFIPPRPPLYEGDEPRTAPEPSAIRVMLLVVTEPRLYRDENGVTFVVFPSFETLDYEAAQDLHPQKGAFAYRFAPYGWDGTCPLDHATYLFADHDVPEFDLDDVTTH